MKEILTYFKWKNFKDTWGMYAVANLLICTVSGIFLVVPYDVNQAYESISRFIILIPGAAFIRNLHYWSAQLVLIFTILHIWDHFKKKTEKKVNLGVWFRLTLVIAITFFVMISGFILKGDADSIQARQILNKLLTSIPLVGDILSRSIIGKEGYQLLYVHHIATATIIIFAVVYEHAKVIWARAQMVFFFLFILALASLFFQAPLHDGFNPVLKGPWYFVGFQEILHLFNSPTFPLIIMITFLLIIFLIRFMNIKWAKWLKKLVVYSFGVYLLLSIIGFYFRGSSWQWITPLEKDYKQQIFFPSFSPLKLKSIDTTFSYSIKPASLQRSESCLVCHTGIQGFTDSHRPESIGCYSCHGGDPFTLNKTISHRTMRLIPGNLNDAQLSCGTANCHPDISSRMPANIMSTMSGVVSVDKWVFGEYEHPSILSDIKELGKSPADIHLKNLCSSCHLGNEKADYSPISEKSRGGGCIACHLNYSKDSRQELSKFTDSLTNKDGFVFNFHPSIDMKVSNEHCFGCHNRSGRISLSYEGWHETELHADSLSSLIGLRVLEDNRVLKYIQEDIHHTKGLLCIDCHTSYEMMGNGKLHAHKEDQLQIRCEDCHLDQQTKTTGSQHLDREESLLFSLRSFGQKDHRFLDIQKSNQLIVNSFVDSLGTAHLFSKVSGEKHPLNPPSDHCNKNKAHQDLSCSACHTSWVPRCIGCHNEYDPNVNGKDLWTGDETKGRWYEYVAEFVADKPTLGVKKENGKREIITMMPGMITSIDLSKYDSKEIKEKHRFERLYAPAASHTTIIPENNCKSCHQNSIMLGYGAGRLVYHIKPTHGEWEFIPFYSYLEQDNLPADAWIGFLQERTLRTATRENIQPFDIKEQKQLLKVASCLECHTEQSEVMNNSLINFQEVLTRLSSKCILPE